MSAVTGSEHGNYFITDLLKCTVASVFFFSIWFLLKEFVSLRFGLVLGSGLVVVVFA